MRGINDKNKWLAISNKIEESGCDIICLQETKRENFDSSYIRHFCPKRLNKFAFQPAVGASGGLFVVWNDSLFSRETVFQNKFSISIKFSSKISDTSWYLTNIYGPCLTEERIIFMNWFKNIQMPDDCNWLVLGDFNYIRYPSNRNREGGNINDMMVFNETISSLGLLEIPLKGRAFTWSNMQGAPLLEKLD